jgi:hypothetical protein
MGAFNVLETDNQEEAAILKAALDGRKFELIDYSCITGGTDGRPYVLTIEGRNLQATDADYYRAFLSGASVMRSVLARAAETARSYEAARCANVDCPDPENSLKVEGGAKVSFRVDALITRGAPRFRVLLCAACYNKHNKAPEGYGRRAKNG